MSYKSPIDLIVNQMNMSFENEIFKAVQNVGVSVDKDELLKALQYDREQYQKGFSDGYEKRDEDIVRCKDCKYFIADKGECVRHHFVVYFSNGLWFCADGRRLE